jgi:hypothetical protein
MFCGMQLPSSRKADASGPVMSIWLIWVGALPMFVTSIDLGSPPSSTMTVPKSKVLAEGDRFAATPIPVSCRLSGWFGPLWLIWSWAVR